MYTYRRQREVRKFADQITLPDGTIFHSGISSINSNEANKVGWDVRTVVVKGPASYDTINKRTLEGAENIYVDDICTVEIKDKLLTDDQFHKKLREAGSEVKVKFVYRGKI